MSDYIGLRIAELRKKQGLTQYALAKMVNLPMMTLSKIESGKTQSPGIKNVQAIAAALGVSMDELVGGEAPEVNSLTLDGFTPQGRALIERIKGDIDCLSKEERIAFAKGLMDSVLDDLVRLSKTDDEPTSSL